MVQNLLRKSLVLLFLIAKTNSVLGSKVELTKSCPKEDTMIIKGGNVSLSYFVRSNGDIYNLCSYKVGLKVVQVFVLNTLFIDVDVNVIGSHFKLFFLAPKWVVLGERRIAVDGAIGTFIPRAANGNIENTTGADGKPGLPGGPGGNFFGSGDEFVNGHSLIITANGGIGGTGQYGGHGFNQQIGRYVDVQAIGSISCGMYYDICRGKDKKYQLNLKDNRGIYSDFVCKGLYEKNNMESCAFKIFGMEGEEGGKGGNGGKGGMGGLPGSVRLAALNNDSHISTYGIAGSRGKYGEGGKGGKSGENGHNIIYKSLFFRSPPKAELEHGQTLFHSIGPSGSDGYNAAGYVEILEAPDVLEQSEIDLVVAEYKAWMKNNS